ncbi:MAG: tetratricopeptide repeat protein [Rhodothermales bacterium]|nr:tetratricopeptide repeat protein [Rhodothermales bacterium]
MRNIIASVLVALAFSTPLAAQTDEAARLLDEGNRLFREGNFEQARIAYEEVTDLGVESGNVYYNLGNAYFRLDRLGKAMLNYQRAFRYFPKDAALTHNMDLVRSRSRDQLSVLPKPIWAKWWNGFVDTVGLRRLFWLGVVGWLAGLALFGRRLHLRAISTAARRLAIVLVVVGGLAGAGAVATSAARTDNVSAVVTADRADVHEEPSSDSRVVIVVHEALVVDVLRNDGDLLQVRLPNGITGFVEPGTIETIQAVRRTE